MYSTFFLFFQVSILINNAGVVSGKPLLETPDHLIQRTFDVNCISHFWVSIIIIFVYVLFYYTFDLFFFWNNRHWSVYILFIRIILLICLWTIRKTMPKCNPTTQGIGHFYKDFTDAVNVQQVIIKRLNLRFYVMSTLFSFFARVIEGQIQRIKNLKKKVGFNTSS